MRKTLMRLAIPLVGIAMLAVGCGDNDNTTTATTAGGATSTTAALPAGSTMAKIKAAGKLRVGTKYDQPLFGEKQLDGKVTGFDVEIAKLVAKAIFGPDGGDKVETTEAPSRVREQVITEDKVDIVVATYTINDTRKQTVSFAGPYYEAGQDILVKKTNTAITGVAGLGGKKVCSVEGSTSIKNVAEKAPTADLSIKFDTYSKCVEALKDGRVEAVTTDDIILLGFAAKDSELKVVGQTFTKEPYGIGVKKDDKQFRDFINDVIDAAYRDGTWAKLFEAQVGKKSGAKTPTPPAVVRY